MKLKLKEDPKEWRKATMLSALGLGILSTLLCWRRILPVAGWRVILVLLAGAALAAFLWPQRFRGYYRVSSRLGFCITWFVGRTILAVLFFLIVTPLGLWLRLLNKDLLRLKRSPGATTYWRQTRQTSPLDRLF